MCRIAVQIHLFLQPYHWPTLKANFGNKYQLHLRGFDSHESMTQVGYDSMIFVSTKDERQGETELLAFVL